jgi:hypothetical protein
MIAPFQQGPAQCKHIILLAAKVFSQKQLLDIWMSYVHRKFIRQGTPRQILVKGRVINIFRGKMAKKKYN